MFPSCRFAYTKACIHMVHQNVTLKKAFATEEINGKKDNNYNNRRDLMILMFSFHVRNDTMLCIHVFTRIANPFFKSQRFRLHVIKFKKTYKAIKPSNGINLYKIT